MAESSLSIGYPDLCEEVGFFLNYGRSGWSAAQESEIDGIVQSGVRRVYFPPAVDPGILGYTWTWLRPSTTLSLVADTGDYDLPDDFGRLIGEFHYASDDYLRSIGEVPLGTVQELRSVRSLSGDPYYVATRYQASTGASGQRQEALFYPTPTAARTLSYQYEAYTGKLSDSYPYPLGGMSMGELYIESCLAVAESRQEDGIGHHSKLFEALLLDAVARDQKRGAKNYGQMGHVEPGESSFRRGWTGSTYPLTYKGESI